MVSRIVPLAIVGSVTLAGCLTVAPPGFIRNGQHTLYRGWFDFNTLNAPAAFFEEVEHLPYSEERVNSYRWMYNRGPGPGLPAAPDRHIRGITVGPAHPPVPMVDALPPPAAPRVVGPDRLMSDPELLPPPPAP